nr:DUF2242 domain-containing protein [Burkholderia thailandensis]
MHNRFRPFLAPSAVAIATVLSACTSAPKPLYQQEQFDATASPYARTFHEKSAATCEAARRALLSQGYMASATRPDAVDGSKNFQPSNDSHVVIEFHVVCADADVDGASSIAYVNAVQDRYSLKKSNTSASVGLSVFGSLSLPIGSSDDAMVKIASETIPAGVFYERFFNLVDHFLKIDPTRRDKAAVKAAEKERVAPLPEPAETAEGAPMKLRTPAAPTPPAEPAPASAAAPEAASAGTAAPVTHAAPASAPATASAPTAASVPDARIGADARTRIRTRPAPSTSATSSIAPPACARRIADSTGAGEHIRLDIGGGDVRFDIHASAGAGIDARSDRRAVTDIADARSATRADAAASGNAGRRAGGRPRACLGERHGNRRRGAIRHPRRQRELIGRPGARAASGRERHRHRSARRSSQRTRGGVRAGANSATSFAAPATGGSAYFVV